MPIKTAGGFLAVIGKFIFKFIWQLKGPRIAKTRLKKNKGKRKAEGLTVPDIKPYYKPRVMKKVSSWHMDRHVDQWNRTENLEINLHIYGQLIFDKDAKTTQWRNVLFNKGCWDN